MLNPRQSWIAAAAILGALSIVMGAFGAHAFEKILTAQQLDSFETGVRYQCYHALALFAMGSSGVFRTSQWHRWAARCWISGTILFSGSIYLLVLRDHIGWSGGAKTLGPLTPIGGALLIAGWLLLGIGALRRKDLKS